MISDPRSACILITFSGVKKCCEPSIIDLNCDPFVSYFPYFVKAENLETAAVCQYIFTPAHKIMKAAGFFNDFYARRKVKMVKISKYYFTAHIIKLLLGDGFYCGFSANRHKYRSFNYTS